MKQNMLICAPVSSRSGYGAHARDLVWSFLNLGKYDIKILDVPWGDTPRDVFKSKNISENEKKILECIIGDPSVITQQPDIYVDIRIPNEFQTAGKFNIGITAGIETNAVSQNWLDSCNKMDLVIVPSEHSKTGFINSAFEKMQNLPNGQQQKVGDLRLEKPIEVLFEGADEDIYKPINNASLEYVDDIPEDFSFLFVGMWGKGGFGEDRKDIGTLIKTFYEAFANKKEKPSLILKTSGASPSMIDREECLKKINNIKNLFPKDWDLPNVYFLHGNLTDKEMNKLYNHPKVKAMVSFTHGEGFGRPLLEATMTGLPVMTTGWSGQMDFLDPDLSLLLPGELKKVPQSAHWENIIIPESSWFIVDTNSAYKGLNMLFNDYDKHKKNAEKQKKLNEKFTLDNMSIELGKIMDKYVSDLPKQVELKLPKLKKVGEPV
tara:strand:- start:837 stop:2138 length:1302 start_codon:yes stop_codon:yes gene_type:complete